MKKILMIGAILALINIAVSCMEKIEGSYVLLDSTYDKVGAMAWDAVDGVTTEEKEFGRAKTKTVIYPAWEQGSEICVYSISTDNLIVCKCISPVIDINKNVGKIIATVAEDCQGYFAVYPPDAMDLDLGDMLDLGDNKSFSGEIQQNNLRYSGKFGDACVMTSWCDWCVGDGELDFVTRTGMLKILSLKSNLLPMHFEIYKKGTSSPVFVSDTWSSELPYDIMYFPLGVSDDEVRVDVYYQNNAKLKSFPEMVRGGDGYGTVKPGTIYTLDGSNLRK